MMKKFLVAKLAVLMFTGCAMLGITSQYRSGGIIDTSLLNGPVSFDFKNPKSTGENLGRGKKMYQAGATVDAKLLTPTGRKLSYLAEAQRTRETQSTIEDNFARLDTRNNKNEICFVATLTHATIDLAKASAWKFKVSVDEGEWISLRHTGRDDTPDYSVSGGSTEWFSVGVYCGKARDWMLAKKSIRLNVFPPVFVNPGEALLAWEFAPKIETK